MGAPFVEEPTNAGVSFPQLLLDVLVGAGFVGREIECYFHSLVRSTSKNRDTRRLIAEGVDVGRRVIAGYFAGWRYSVRALTSCLIDLKFDSAAVWVRDVEAIPIPGHSHWCPFRCGFGVGN